MRALCANEVPLSSPNNYTPAAADLHLTQASSISFVPPSQEALQARDVSVVRTFPVCSHYWFTFGQHAQLEKLSFSPSNSVLFIWALWLLVT